MIIINLYIFETCIFFTKNFVFFNKFFIFFIKNNFFTNNLIKLNENSVFISFNLKKY